MGKQSRTRQQRKVAREAQQPMIDEWSTIPEDALTGICRNPNCPIINCVDPLVSVSFEDKDPVVIVSFTVLDEEDRHSHQVKVNGEIVVRVHDQQSKQQMAHKMVNTLTDRFGSRGTVAILHHLKQLMAQHHSRPVAQA